MSGLHIALMVIALALTLYLILDAMDRALVYIKYDYETKIWEFRFVYPTIKKVKVEFYKYQPTSSECQVLLYQIGNNQCIEAYSFIKGVGSDKAVFWTKTNV